MNVIDHPCKETCSGWAQGYEKGKVVGVQALATALRKLLKPEESEYFESVISRAKFEFEMANYSSHSTESPTDVDEVKCSECGHANPKSRIACISCDVVLATNNRSGK